MPRLAVHSARSTTSRCLTLTTGSHQCTQTHYQQLIRLAHTSSWRPAMILEEWAAREARPVSLRQLMVFGRSLSEQRLLSSANYVRTELPIRIAHRLSDMQALPYHVVANRNFNEVYELYYGAFDSFRKFKEVKTLEDNDRFCERISEMLKAHLAVIPKLAMGVLESCDQASAVELDCFMNGILRSRISRRVIAEQHLSLTETFHSPWFSPGVIMPDTDSIGNIFLKCNAKDVITRCGDAVKALARTAYGDDILVPEIRLTGHLEVNFPYILSHLEFIIGELLRNSVQAIIEKQQRLRTNTPPPPIEVTICEASQHVMIRVSDQGGGIPHDKIPHLWSFCKGPQSERVLDNLNKVPTMAATMKEVHIDDPVTKQPKGLRKGKQGHGHDSSLSSLTSRPPYLRLGMGLPLSRIYAGYWAGSLEVHSLEGYGVDAFLQISKLGNQNEQLATRASMDAI